MFFRIIEYLKYLFNAKTAFGIHAPFAFDFYTKVIRSKNPLPEVFNEIENRRKLVLESNETIQVTDLGTGKRKNRDKRQVSYIARRYANKAKDAYLLYRIVEFLKPNNILELGTSLGFTTMYMAIAAPKAQIYTIEGCPETANIARQNFKLLDISLNSLIGNIDLILPELLKNGKIPEFIFFDANHTKEATLRYFNMCLPYVNERTVFVFDDIYWSAGMKQAWLIIISHPEISLSIDIFRFGIVFFKKNSLKQHFVLKY